MSNPNYALCFDYAVVSDIGPSRHSRVSVELVGAEDLVLKGVLSKPPARLSSSSVSLRVGSPPFSAKAELARLLSTPPVYTAEQLIEADAAARRLEEGGPPSIDEIADLLSKDLSQFLD